MDKRKDLILEQLQLSERIKECREVYNNAGLAKNIITGYVNASPGGCYDYAQGVYLITDQTDAVKLIQDLAGFIISCQTDENEDLIKDEMFINIVGLELYNYLNSIAHWVV